MNKAKTLSINTPVSSNDGIWDFSHLKDTARNILTNSNNSELSFQEESLTEVLLLEIAMKSNPCEVKVFAHTKPAESKTGADLELWVRRDGGYVGFIIQMKKSNAIGKFRGNEDQFKKLNNYTPYEFEENNEVHRTQIQMIPVYGFYSVQHGIELVSTQNVNISVSSFSGSSNRQNIENFLSELISSSGHSSTAVEGLPKYLKGSIGTVNYAIVKDIMLNFEE